MRKYWYVLLGMELYSYKNQGDQKHKDMQSLASVFIKSQAEEKSEDGEGDTKGKFEDGEGDTKDEGECDAKDNTKDHTLSHIIIIIVYCIIEIKENFENHRVY